MNQDTFRAGQFTFNGSAQQLTTIPKNVASVVIKALMGNTGPCYVGYDNTVSSTTGFELGPGDAMPLEVVNPSRLWVIGTNAEKLCWASVAA